MKKLSTGDDSTLGNWRDLTAAAFGADSKATAFLDEKIAEQGRDAEVLADESQMLVALVSINLGDEAPPPK